MQQYISKEDKEFEIINRYQDILSYFTSLFIFENIAVISFGI